MTQKIFTKYVIDGADKQNQFHNSNDLFYTLSPATMVGIEQAFGHVMNHSPHLLEKGGYYEFGLFKGFSLWFAQKISQTVVGENFIWYGFDSFQGLPENSIDLNTFWRPGSYAVSEDVVRSNISEHGGNTDRMSIWKGWFSHELFSAIALDHEFRPPAIILVDSDIYEACCEILAFFGPMLQRGSIVIFDEYRVDALFENTDEHGEKRAFCEFQDRSKQKFELLAEFGSFGSMFTVV